MGIKLYPSASYVFQSEYLAVTYTHRRNILYVGIGLALPSTLPVDAIALNKPLVYRTYYWNNLSSRFSIEFKNNTSETVTVTLAQLNSSQEVTGTEVLQIPPGASRQPVRSVGITEQHSYSPDYTIEVVTLEFDTSLVIPHCYVIT